MSFRSVIYLFFSFGSLLPQFAVAQTPAAANILRNCCQVHDPEGKWANLSNTFTIVQSEPAGQTFFTVQLQQRKNVFLREEMKDGRSLVRRFKKGRYQCLLDGRNVITAAEEQQFGLDEPTARQWMEAFVFLNGAPMKQALDAAFLLEEVRIVSFAGKQCFRITLQYPPVGQNESWYFYINKETFILEGCTFFLNNPAKDGGTIAFSGFVLFDEILFSKEKRWINNADKKWLQTEIIERITH
jgi:hypothetical protein